MLTGFFLLNAVFNSNDWMAGNWKAIEDDGMNNIPFFAFDRLFLPLTLVLSQALVIFLR